MSLEQLEAREVPAFFAVGLLSPATGDAGDSAATFTGGIALNPALPTHNDRVIVDAPSATAAIHAALVNTVTATVGGQSVGYTPDDATVGTSPTTHRPFIITPGTAAGQFVLRLEDLAGMPGQTPDWDYNDRTWGVAVDPLFDPLVVAPPNPPATGADPVDPGAVTVVPVDPAAPPVPPVPATPSQPGPYLPPPTDPPPPTGTVHGWAWNDANADGVMQSTEGKLNAVGVWLYAAAGGSYVAQTWTNDAGEYQFTGVGLGDYRVTFKAPAPAAFTLYRQGTNPQLDSDVVTATTSGYGNTPAVSVTAANLTLWDISAGFILGADPKPTTIKLSVAGLDDKDKGKAPGKKAHINDNFDEGQKTMQALVSDNLPDPGTGEHQIKAGDPDLVPATLNMTSGVTDWWMLDWTIGPNVKVWYKGWVGPNAGKWVEANDMEFGKIAVPATIDLMVEGMDVGAGTVKVELVVKKGNPGVADEAAFTVYTGLRLTGTKAADAVGQLENATGWTLNKNAAGDIWRTGGALNPEQWRKDAQAATKPIFENEKVTSIAAENKKEIQIGNWDLKALDPNDISVFYTADERWGAGAITHEIVEQYHGQVLGKNYNQAHAAAIVVESKIVAGGGTRTDTPKRIPGTNKIELTLEFQNGIIATLVLDLDRAVNPTNVNFRRP